MNAHSHLYRGQSWDPAPLPTSGIEHKPVEGLYRGHAYAGQTFGWVASSAGAFDLRYRGVVTYAAPVAAVAPATATPRRLSILAFTGLGMPQDVREQLASIHHENVMYRLQRRIQSARERGDEHLVQMLEAEQQQA